MTLDWSKATKGAKLKFLCGGEMIINLLKHYESDDTRQIYGPDDVYAGWYNSDGRLRSDKESLLDIIEIIPAPEPKRFEFWVNVYLSKRGVVWFGSTHTSKEDAEESVVYTDDTRIACVHHIGKEGDGL